MKFHSAQWSFLDDMRKSDQLAHAFLFTGPPGVGKKDFSLEFAKLLQKTQNDNHPDIIITSVPLPIKEAKELKGKLSKSPFSGDYKIVIIESPEEMQGDALNSLLKM